MIIWLAYIPKAEYEREKNKHAASCIVLFLCLHIEIDFLSSFISGERNAINLSQGINLLSFTCL